MVSGAGSRCKWGGVTWLVGRGHVVSGAGHVVSGARSRG